MATNQNDDRDAFASPVGNRLATVTPNRRNGAVVIIQSAVHHVPTLLVLIALCGVGFWGHKNDWRAPKFASLFGRPAVREAEDWCAQHNVPDSRCIKCHPELAGETAKDWCKEHGVPESRCTICHPEILTKGVASDWCKEHGVPESNCTICHPEIAVKGKPPVSETDVKVVRSEGAAAKPTVVGVEGIAKDSDSTLPTTTKPMRDPATCQTHLLRVQFASPQSVKKAGVRLGSVVERPMQQTIIANAETQYDRARFAQVAPRVSGAVWRVDKEIGQPVHKGDVLALVDAADVGRVKAELLTATAQRELRNQTVRRINELLPQKISTTAELQEAQAALRESEIRMFNARQALINLGLTATVETERIPNERELQLLGLPKEVQASLEVGAPSANLVPLVAPLDGVVTRCDVVAGEVVEASKPLFVIADSRRMWLTIDVPQAQIGRVMIGQTVRFLQERSDDAVRGTISWISTAVDDQTRTVKVRAELENLDGRILASTFGRAYITVRDSPKAIAVPTEAIQWEGCCHIVFVRLADDIFQTRKVRLGSRDSYYTEVFVGLSPGEVVATVGSHVLKSEILKSKLGAGCCAE